jgi:hypothetical protein
VRRRENGGWCWRRAKAIAKAEAEAEGQRDRAASSEEGAVALSAAWGVSGEGEDLGVVAQTRPWPQVGDASQTVLQAAQLTGRASHSGGRGTVREGRTERGRGRQSRESQSTAHGTNRTRPEQTRADQSRADKTGRPRRLWGLGRADQSRAEQRRRACGKGALADNISSLTAN